MCRDFAGQNGVRKSILCMTVQYVKALELAIDFFGKNLAARITRTLDSVDVWSLLFAARPTNSVKFGGFHAENSLTIVSLAGSLSPHLVYALVNLTFDGILEIDDVFSVRGQVQLSVIESETFPFFLVPAYSVGKWHSLGSTVLIICGFVSVPAGM